MGTSSSSNEPILYDRDCGNRSGAAGALGSGRRMRLPLPLAVALAMTLAAPPAGARQPTARDASYWALRWLLWLETVLVTYAFFA
jgi:hypothetical protein